MKTKVILAAIVITVLFVAAMPVPKTNSVSVTKKITGNFDYIRSHRQGKHAVVSWAYTTGGATSFVLQKTDQDPYDIYSMWYDVSTVANNASRSYKVTDESPFGGTTYYRVIAVSNSGPSEVSDLTSVRIVAH